ncbi:MAG: carbohydrate ABC transporter permease [Defluviitaleaceae bacterium]|nr:carbohydrate ABC transporter permease [Defluviitaleaceae bacterium]MCL2263596.1 carbohydrate ABC transporter permease [Defluviitaleaceae bacterium]
MVKAIRQGNTVAKRRKKNSRAVRKPNRSLGGDIFIWVILAFFGAFFAFPLVFAINNAFKPLDEIFIVPPNLWVINPTMGNLQDLFIIMSRSWVAFSRYIFNTVFITAAGTVGHLFVASLGAYAVSKYEFPGSKFFFGLVITTLMFNGFVMQIPNFLILANLGWIDTYWAVIIPAFGMPLGFFLLKQFMDTVPMSLIESAKIDGAGEWLIYSRIVMPLVKPALLTAMIFSVQALWNNPQALLIYTEQLKTLPLAITQIIGSPHAPNVARAGVNAAGILVMMFVPITLFIFAQSNILKTMASSGIKE